MSMPGLDNKIIYYNFFCSKPANKKYEFQLRYHSRWVIIIILQLHLHRFDTSFFRMKLLK